MKKTLLATLIAVVAGLGLASLAHAATDEQRAAVKEKWAAKTPEEQAAAKAQAKAKWNAMTPEQQAAAKKNHPRMARRAAKQEAEAAPK